jgi:PIN domain nuclease of toxin-antitoxin system
MKILVDTHAILWWLAGDKRLSRPAKRILEDPANRRWVSIASLWEIAIKMSTGRLTTHDLTLRTIVDQLSEQEFLILPVRVADLLQLEQLAQIHGDPFDRILIAQAVEERVPILTTDAMIAQYPIKTIWKK